MRRVRRWVNQLAGLTARRRREADLALELESHIEMHTDENIRRGMPPADARRQAIVMLGGMNR